jgi:S1-C subfamily serine protease
MTLRKAPTVNPVVPVNTLPESRPQLADAVERVAASTVGLGTRRRGLAAGVVWKAGVVVTAASAIGHAGKVQVVRPDGEAVVGDVRGADGGTDLAVVAFDTGSLPGAERRLDPPLRAGDFVFAVGRAASGLVHASFGHIGAAGGAWRTWRGGAVDRLLRLDGGLYPGLAGAPVADAQGQVIGIASPALSRHHGVVLPVATVDRVVALLLAHGHVRRGHIGIAAQAVALSAAMQGAAATGATSGLLVAGIGDDSPAARAGLMVGDVIVAAGGREVPDIETLRDLLAADQIGSRLRLNLLRGGQPLELGIEVAEHRPAARC